MRPSRRANRLGAGKHAGHCVRPQHEATAAPTQGCLEAKAVVTCQDTRTSLERIKMLVTVARVLGKHECPPASWISSLFIRLNPLQGPLWGRPEGFW